MKHSELKQKAKDAIEKLHADKSVSLEVVLESLEEIEGDVQTCIDCINDDIEAKNGD